MQFTSCSVQHDSPLSWRSCREWHIDKMLVVFTQHYGFVRWLFFFWLSKSAVETLSLFKYWGGGKTKVLPTNQFCFNNSEIFVQH